jgi:hypothetical protein
MGKSERRKGRDGEAEVAALFREFGFDCDRTPNSGGLRIKGDLYGSIPVHVEVKRQEIARPWEWHAQAKREAGEATPVVVFRRNSSEWLALISARHLAFLLMEPKL